MKKPVLPLFGLFPALRRAKDLTIGKGCLNRPCFRGHRLLRFIRRCLPLITLLILIALSQAGTAALGLERQRLESLTGLNTAEATERGAPLSAFSAPSAAPAVQSLDTTTCVSAALRSAPVMFIENVGQFDERARFQVRGGMGTMWLTEDAIWITVVERLPADALERFNVERTNMELKDEPRRAVNLKLSFPGANPHPRIEPFDRLDTVVSYFIGSHPDQWRRNLPVWGGVRYVDLYPGLDLEVTSENGRWIWRLAYRADCQPALRDVRLRVEGADALTLDDDQLRLSTTVGDFTLSLLTVEGLSVECAHVERANAETFEVSSPFSSAPPLPSASARTAGASDLLYATFLGGGSNEWGLGIAVDGSGAAYVTGGTSSLDFPTTPGAFDTSYNGNGDAFVVKLNSTGTALAYATFLGGSGGDAGSAITVDRAGDAYVTGYTSSSDFPTTTGAFDTSYNGVDTFFIVKLNTTGTALVYSTFLGRGVAGCVDYIGYCHDCGIAVDSSGAAYVTGGTNSSDFPTTPGAFDTSYNGGEWDAFVVKLNSTGSALAYATFLGGSGSERGMGITIDSSGAAHITGATGSSDFPITPAAFDTSYNGGDCDAFAVKLNPTGSALVYATFLGGDRGDNGYDIAVDSSGAAYITGVTRSSDFPTTPGAFDQAFDCHYSDAFVSKLNATGSALAYSTFLGGNEDSDEGHSIAVDSSGAVYVTGLTYSVDFPTTTGAFTTTKNGGHTDAFVVKFNPPGSALLYATFLGGGDWDEGSGIAVDGSGTAYVTGRTYSSDFPTTAGAFDTSYDGGHYGYEAFVAKLSVGGGAPVIYVPDDYPTIQAAVDAATPGDTIIVRDGTYAENVRVDKDHLTIKSENGPASTIVKAGGSGDYVFALLADYVNISGFTVTTGSYEVWNGISVRSSNNLIKDCILYGDMDTAIDLTALQTQWKAA